MDLLADELPRAAADLGMEIAAVLDGARTGAGGEVESTITRER